MTVAEPPAVPVPRELLESLIDADDCWFDHHGGCQAHGYLSLAAGEKCPQQVAKDLLAAVCAECGLTIGPTDDLWRQCVCPRPAPPEEPTT